MPFNPFPRNPVRRAARIERRIARNETRLEQVQAQIPGQAAVAANAPKFDNANQNTQSALAQLKDFVVSLDQKQQVQIDALDNDIGRLAQKSKAAPMMVQTGGGGFGDNPLMLLLLLGGGLFGSSSTSTTSSSISPILLLLLFSGGMGGSQGSYDEDGNFYPSSAGGMNGILPIILLQSLL